jgi:hypothetical protein
VTKPPKNIMASWFGTGYYSIEKKDITLVKYKITPIVISELMRRIYPVDINAGSELDIREFIKD